MSIIIFVNYYICYLLLCFPQNFKSLKGGLSCPYPLPSSDNELKKVIYFLKKDEFLQVFFTLLSQQYLICGVFFGGYYHELKNRFRFFLYSKERQSFP